MPVSDPRQDISAAWRNGMPFAPALLAYHVFGAGHFTDLRVIETVHAAGSAHTLRVRGTRWPCPLPSWAAAPCRRWSVFLFPDQLGSTPLDSALRSFRIVGDTGSTGIALNSSMLIHR